MSIRQVSRRVAGGTLVVLASAEALGAGAQLQAQQPVVASGRYDVSAERRESVLAVPVTIDLKQVGLKQAVNAISERANVPIYYRSELLDAVTEPVSLHATQVPLGVVLARILAGTNLRATPSVQGTVAIKVAGRDVGAEDGIVVGKVVNAKTKQPVSATITVDDGSQNVVTGNDGALRLSLAPGQYRVTARAVGFLKQTRQVTVAAGQTISVEFSLESSASVLDEVVVTGSVIATERKAIPTPITVVTAADIEKRGITRIDQLFRGEIPGVVALDFGSSNFGSDGPGASVKTQLYSRGSASFTGEANPPKVYVDGVELADPGFLGTIDPKSIERIEVIAGPQAASLYGSGAISGVMQIFTKKGSGRTTPDVTLNLRYGMLSTNVNNGYAPRHDDNINVMGGTGPNFSYSVTGTHFYDGQWVSGAWLRTFGATAGVMHTTGPVTANASVSVTSTKNSAAFDSPYITQQQQNGEWTNYGYIGRIRPRISTATSQLAAFNVDYRATSIWQHHVSVGKAWNIFDVDGREPSYAYPGRDTTISNAGQTSGRTSGSYNMTFTPSLGRMTSSFVLGATGAWGSSKTFYADLPYQNAPSYSYVYMTRSIDDNNYGGFGSMQVGIFDRLFLTAGIRGEHSPRYGADHRIDWTPTTGMSLVLERGFVTAKLLTSYGRTTTPPLPDQREEQVAVSPWSDPGQYITVFANPNLKPQHGRGPQGGIELYFGNVVSLTVNHYRQYIDDMILPVAVDTISATYIDEYGGGTYSVIQKQYRNAANILQKGWEGTGSLTLGAFTVKGTYSWMDSRVMSLGASYPNGGKTIYLELGNGGLALINIGSPFYNAPTHSGNVTMNYAHGPTSVTLVSNWIGSAVQTYNGNTHLVDDVSNMRLKMYTVRQKTVYMDITRPGYVKSDLAASHRLTRSMSATLNITNIGDLYVNDYNKVLWPSLGRQMLFGVSLRFPSNS